MIFKRKLRHVLVESTKEVDFRSRALWEEMKGSMARTMGEAEYFRANPSVAAAFTNNVFVFTVNRGHERSLVLALSFIKSLGNEKIGFYTIKISGTIRSLRTAYKKLYGPA